MAENTHKKLTDVNTAESFDSVFVNDDKTVKQISKERLLAEIENSAFIKNMTKDVNDAVQNANDVASDLETKRDSGYFNGKDGIDGKDGAPGEKGDVGPQGPRGEQGDAGQNGEDGKDGYTPRRGIDYWTPEDVAEINRYIDSKFGDVENALDSIIAIQNELIGGDEV